MFIPDLKPMVEMAIGNLNAVLELVGNGDKPIQPKAAKHARRAKSLVVEVIQQINDIMQAQKATVEGQVNHDDTNNALSGESGTLGRGSATIPDTGDAGKRKKGGA